MALSAANIHGLDQKPIAGCLGGLVAGAAVKDQITAYYWPETDGAVA